MFSITLSTNSFTLNKDILSLEYPFLSFEHHISTSGKVKLFFQHHDYLLSFIKKM